MSGGCSLAAESPDQEFMASIAFLNDAASFTGTLSLGSSGADSVAIDVSSDSNISGGTITSGGTGSKSSAIRHCRWSRAACLPSGMRRRAG